MKIVDAHCHLHKAGWVKNKVPNNDFFNDILQQDFDETTILKEMAEAGIDKSVIFPLPSLFVDTETANHYVVSIARRYPDQFIPFAIVDQKPAYWIENGVKGFKEHTYGQRIQKDSNGNDIFAQEFKQTYAYMERHRIPLLLHAGVNRVERLKNDLFAHTPDLIVILAHLGADFPQDNAYRPRVEQVEATLTALAPCPNLYYDISALEEPSLIESALEILGSQKILFGTDFPYQTGKRALEVLDSVKRLTPGDRQNILFKNIVSILDMQEHPGV